MKKIPYGISDYYSIQTDHYLYVDKTWGIRQIEEEGNRYLVSLRPRRFGKSLWISTLENYYDINKKEQFDRLFGSTYIGEHKTDLANSFYILRFEFSGLKKDNLQRNFTIKVRSTLESFNEKYGFDIDMSNSRFHINDPEMVLFEYLNEVTKFLDHKIYILIDEYDHFANSLLQDFELFKEVTSKDGFVRHFYEVIKDFTGKGIVDRLFITGVTSLTLDSFTSGFNIAKNISNSIKYNDLFGFTSEETKELLANCQIDSSHFQLVKDSYNGYKFNIRADHAVFNSNMVLYFADSYIEEGTIPDSLTDPNISSDYIKVTSMFSLFKDHLHRKEILEGIIDQKPIFTNIVTNFSIPFQSFDKEDFYSLLYYLGLLTIKGSGFAYDVELQTPNAVIRDIYYQYYAEYLKIPNTNEALAKLACGDFSLYNETVEEILNAHADEDFKNFNEARLKSVFLSSLSGQRQKLYLMKSEYAVEGRRIDIALMSRYPQYNNYLIEIKYIQKSKATDQSVRTLTEKATKQIQEYLKLDEFKDLPNLMGVIYVVSKNKIIHFQILN